jgi:hypothetical protein
MRYCDTFSTAHSTEHEARRAVDAMHAAGVPRQDTRLLTGRALHDTRRQPVGGWASPLGPDARVGTFGGGARRRSQGAGSYAGDPDEQRQGSWADVERVVIVTFEDDGERSRTTGLRRARRLLRKAQFDDAAIAFAGTELERGHAVVLVRLAEIAPREAEQLARAA